MAAAGWSQGNTGGAVCASCHQAIYESYRATPMAASARKLDPSSVPERFDRGSFNHAASGFEYKVSVKNSAYVVDFDKKSGGSAGSIALAYAVGSGARAFSYLIANDGFLYEAPVAYYATGGYWGLENGYGGYSYPNLTRPVAPGCLSCHVSFLQVLPLTLNRYASPPFLEGGIACERCHGNGQNHVARMQAGDFAGGPQILNPAKLAPDRRDSICEQCHLSGDVRVMHRGSDWSSFQPGDRLADYQTVFVRSEQSNGNQLTRHVENLALSACKRRSGERLWCGTCHDPHVVPAKAQASAWFRARCLSCHATEACSETAAARSRAKDDCMGCHMPKIRSKDAEHVVFTDHSIPRRPHAGAATAVAADAPLVPFGGAPASSRDLALAYAIAAVGQTSGADRTRALSLLEAVVKEAPGDVEVLLSLAEIYRIDGKGDMARPLYERAIELDPGQVTASVGLGGVMMENGEYAQAIRLWNDALSKNAGLELVRLNLALALWKTGDRASAESDLRTALILNPAFAPARELLDLMNHTPQK